MVFANFMISCIFFLIPKFYGNIACNIRILRKSVIKLFMVKAAKRNLLCHKNDTIKTH